MICAVKAAAPDHEKLQVIFLRVLSSAEKTAQEGLIMAVAVPLDRALVTLAAHGS
jgi:hypothetical protein